MMIDGQYLQLEIADGLLCCGWSWFSSDYCLEEYEWRSAGCIKKIVRVQISILGIRFIMLEMPNHQLCYHAGNVAEQLQETDSHEFLNISL